MGATDFSGEGRRGDTHPGAKSAGTGGTMPRENGAFAGPREQSTIARGTIAGLGRGTPPRKTDGTVQNDQRRNLYAENTQNSSALRPLTTQELTRQVQCIVLSFPTRDVVDDTQASIRAIENVRNGDSGMSLKTFVNLCRSNPRARAMAAPLFGYGDESDPNVVQAISVLLNELVRHPAETHDVRNDGRPQAAEGHGGDAGGGDESATGDLFEGLH